MKHGTIINSLVDERDRLRREKADLEAVLIAILLDIKPDSLGGVAVHDSTRGAQALNNAKALLEKTLGVTP